MADKAADSLAEFLKVAEITPGSSCVNVIGEVLSVETKLHVVSSGATVRRVAEVVVGDQTGTVMLRLPCSADEQTPCEVGECLVIRGARVEMFDGRVRLELGKWGRAVRMQGAYFPPASGERPDISAVEYGLLSS
eukprot:TRINITY_DN77170_c0_g1_i1.p2 TRINITY_DN77170_c0_g1~~TRINITY_DN77170_c0_g1_i1.p2  ORF type:complete len:135 (+),score=22.41 TRINITY_DN77170_c0_g1_i1:37-441(+)